MRPMKTVVDVTSVRLDADLAIEMMIDPIVGTVMNFGLRYVTVRRMKTEKWINSKLKSNLFVNFFFFFQIIV